MADFGEYTPMYAQTGFDGRWWNEEYNEILHGYLPQDWASLNRYVLAINKAKFIEEIKAKKCSCQQISHLSTNQKTAPQSRPAKLCCDW